MKKSKYEALKMLKDKYRKNNEILNFINNNLEKANLSDLKFRGREYATDIEARSKTTSLITLNTYNIDKIVLDYAKSKAEYFDAKNGIFRWNRFASENKNENPYLVMRKFTNERLGKVACRHLLKKSIDTTLNVNDLSLLLRDLEYIVDVEFALKGGCKDVVVKNKHNGDKMFVRKDFALELLLAGDFILCADDEYSIDKRSLYSILNPDTGIYIGVASDIGFQYLDQKIKSNKRRQNIAGIEYFAPKYKRDTYYLY